MEIVEAFIISAPSSKQWSPLSNKTDFRHLQNKAGDRL